MQNQTQIQAGPVQVTTPKLSYVDMVERIEKKKYDRSVFARWKTSNSHSMEEVTAGLRSINNLVREPVGRVPFSSIKAAYDMAQNACLKYLSTHKPKTDEGKARFDLVEKIQFQIADDMRVIDANGGTLSAEDMALTWKEVISKPPVLKAVHDEERNAVEGIGALSYVKKVRTETGEEFYFKREETMPKEVKSFPRLILEVRDNVRKMISDLDNPETQLSRSYKTEEEKTERRKILAKAEEILPYIARYVNFIDLDVLSGMDQSLIIKHLEEINKKLSPEKKLSIPKEGTEEFDFFKLAAEEAAKLVEKQRALAGVGNAEGRIRGGAGFSVRNEATTVLAKQLGLSDMVTESHKVTLVQDGERIEGFRMQKMVGLPESKIQETYSSKKVKMTPQALKQLMNLYVFDIICGQVDRHGENFLSNVEMVGDKVVVKGISAIDNDMSFGALRYQEIRDLNFLNRMEDDEGNVLLPAIDSELAEKIKAMKPEMLRYILAPYLEEEEILACQDRLKGVQQVLRKAKKQGKQFTTDEEWEKLITEMETATDTEFANSVRGSYLTPMRAGRRELFIRK
ncbi:MAG: hypothetical protein K6E95_03935 [Lachnospiraceae bacterium]|nr:hypothetical protein [Lachnospiraceae bacterium]